MNTIDCQACQTETREQTGCHTCGGYGVLLSQIVVCHLCNKLGWVRPGVWTTYEGKQYRTFDGVEMICHEGGPGNCMQCEEKIQK